MIWSKNPKCAEICTIVGVHFLMAPYSFSWIYGNLLTYINSFIHTSCYPKCLDGDTQWIFNLYLALIGLGLFLFDSIRRAIGLRCTFILTIVVHNSAFLLSAWTIQISVVITCIVIGVVMGLATGLTMNIAFMYLNLWAPKNSEVYMVTVTSIGPLLSVVQNLILTEFVNPQNLKPDAHQGPRVFFSQPEILSRVPTAITILASMTFALQLIGCLLVSAPPTDKSNSALMSICKKIIPAKESNKRHFRICSFVAKKNKINTALSTSTEKEHVTKNGLNGYGSHDGIIVHDITTSDPVENGSSDSMNNNNNNNNNNENNTEMVIDVSKECEADSTVSGTRPIQFTPSQAIKTAQFWSLWLYGCAIGLGMMLMDSYYKQFGLLYIPNDQHLTVLGSILPALVCMSRVVFGSLLKQRLVNVNSTLIFSLFLNCLASSFWYFSAMISELVYMCILLAMAWSYSFLHFVLANGTFQEFGTENFATIYSMAYSGLPIVSVASALYLSPLLNAVGWFWVFMSSSFLSFVALSFSIFSKMCPPRAKK